MQTLNTSDYTYTRSSGSVKVGSACLLPTFVILKTMIFLHVIESFSPKMLLSEPVRGS